MMILVGYLLLTSYAQAYISIQVPKTSIDYGKTDISISCIVNSTLLKSIGVIQLKRSDIEIVSISEDGVEWNDNQLQNRSYVDASIANVQFSYLYLSIMACDVNNTIDQDTYQCDLSALEKDGPAINQVSEEVYLNITGERGEKCLHICFPTCDIYCLYGDVLDKHGCKTCKCKPKPVHNITVFSKEPNVFLVILAMLLSTYY